MRAYPLAHAAKADGSSIRTHAHAWHACAHSEAETTMNYWLGEVKKEQSQLTYKFSDQIDRAVLSPSRRRETGSRH